MAWVDGVDQPTGFLVTAATWNQYLGAGGSLQGLKLHTHTNAAGDGAPIDEQRGLAAGTGPHIQGVS